MFGGWQSKQRDRHDIPPGRGDRHDVRCTDRERSTSNVQLSTFNGVTERADGGPDMGTDTMLKRCWTGEFGCGTQIWGQARCLIYRSGTLNVQRSTLNFQLGDRKGGWRAGYGDRHDM